MLRCLVFLICFLACFNIEAQKIAGQELLNKAIAYHDPNNVWPTFKGQLDITMQSPEGKERASAIKLDLPKQYFELTSSQDGNTTTQILDKGECTLLLNGKMELTDEDIKTHKLDCDRVRSMKNYYTYLYGLPMKLKDPGALISPEVQLKSFNGKEYLVLNVKYEEGVGKDSWYFYFDPKTFAMEVYQFFHDESTNDGEYIVLSGLENGMGIIIPKTRAWYYNKDDTYLGTDVLTKVSTF